MEPLLQSFKKRNKLEGKTKHSKEEEKNENSEDVKEELLSVIQDFTSGSRRVNFT